MSSFQGVGIGKYIEVSSFQGVGIGKYVEVSSFQGVGIGGVPLYLRVVGLYLFRKLLCSSGLVPSGG